MDDGTNVKSGLRLCTYNFNYLEHEVLVKVFKDVYDLNCTIQNRDNGQYCLYIKSESKQKLVNIVKPYIIPSMQYKIKWSKLQY